MLFTLRSGLAQRDSSFANSVEHPFPEAQSSFELPRRSRHPLWHARLIKLPSQLFDFGPTWVARRVTGRGLCQNAQTHLFTLTHSARCVASILLNVLLAATRHLMAILLIFNQP